MNKLKPVSVLLAVMLVLQGCWDRIEIQERGFVVGVGIDLKPMTEEEEEAGAGPRQLLGTFQIIDPSAVQGGSASGGSQKGGNAYVNISATEHSMSTVAAQISSKVGREPFFEHLGIMVISSEAARDPSAYSNAIDFFLRNPEMRRNVKMLIAKEKASDILATPPLNENYPVIYLDNILDNNRKNSYLLQPKLLGDLHQDLLADYSYRIQAVERSNIGIQLSGAAVFDGTDNTLQGFLTGQETQGLNFLMGTVRGGVLEAFYEGQPIDLLIDRANHAMAADISNPEKPVFRVAIMIEGALDQSVPGMKINDTPLLRSLFEEKVVAICMRTVQKLQQELKLDPAGFGQHLMRRHYRLWKRDYADKWDKEVFPAAEIQVEATVIIRRIGNINESERS